MSAKLTLSTVLLMGLATGSLSFAPSAGLQLRTPSHMSTMKMSEQGRTSLSLPAKLVTAAAAISIFLGGGMADVSAVSGGVADFSDVQDQDLSGKDLRKKDFSSANCRNAKFVGAKLQGARFFKADMQGADLTDANLSNGSIENAKLQGVILKNAILKNAYTGVGLEQVKDISGADFTGAQIRPDVLIKLCKRPDAAGTNSQTKADTRESLECP